MGRRAFSDDSGVSEVIGFILSFALSAVFLMIALSAFNTARSNSDAVVTGAELKTIADRVASRIVEAGLVAEEFPNATMNLTVNLPMQLNGHTYTITATNDSIDVFAPDLALSASSTTFKLDAITGVWIDGEVISSNEVLIITYSLQPGGTKRIHIHEES